MNIYEPYTLGQWIDTFDLLKEVRLRDKDNHDCIVRAVYCGYIQSGKWNESSGNIVMLGGMRISLVDLFDNYEIFIKGKWQPAGEQKIL